MKYNVLLPLIILVILGVLISGCTNTTQSGSQQGSSTTQVSTQTQTGGTNQPTITQTPVPTATPIPTISLSGKGQQASQMFHLEEGLAIFNMKHSGSDNYAIWLMDSKGQKVELLVNTIGSFDGSKALGITTAGDYILDITADGAWSVNIDQPRPTRAQAAPVSLSGSGQKASQFFQLEPGLATFKMTHDGSSNFAVWLDDSNGNHVDLLANDIGPFDGSKAEGIDTGGVYVLDIEADGNWKIDISQ